jgi:hypothetical protein
VNAIGAPATPIAVVIRPADEAMAIGTLKHDSDAKPGDDGGIPVIIASDVIALRRRALVAATV